MRSTTDVDAQTVLAEWSWLVPHQHRPLLLSVFGDWVFGAPDGSHWALSVLDGTYTQIANNSSDFNAKKASREWLDETFLASWQEIAHRHGLVPSASQCIGWRIPLVVGGAFEVTNMQLVSHAVYQSVMAQLHQQLGSR